MIFGLVLDVFDGLGQMGNAHTEGAITLLPGNCVVLERHRVPRPMLPL